MHVVHHHEPTVLVVDDEPAVRRLTLRALERGGLAALVATSGHEAVRLFADSSADIVLAILDLTLDDMNGVDVARHLLARIPDLPILFVSGHDEASVPTDLRMLPAVDFVAKPFRLSTLLNRVDRLMSTRTPILPT